jgi:two-component system chemotaxis sensor kinase CheA
MPTPDEDFIKQLRATFNVEAEEHLQSMSSMLLELEKAPLSTSKAASIESIYREAHSLKGAARAVDLADIEAICHALEGVFAQWKRNQSDLSPQSFDALQSALDAIRDLLASSTTKPDDNQRHRRDQVIRRLGALELVAPAAHDVASVNIVRETALSPDPKRSAHATSEPSISPAPPTRPLDSEPDTTAETVRISVSKLDSRLLQAEDMLTVKATLAQRAAELREITTLFAQWRREWAKVSAESRAVCQESQRGSDAGSAMLAGFLDWNSDYLRSLESKIASIAARAEQDRHTVGQRIDELLEDSKKLLMLPFATLAGMFPKLVRDLCRDQGKEADLVLVGSDVEIDKRILEEMKDALIHALRNCIDHGIENPAERTRLNKPARATITLAVSQVNGSKVEILVSDDGAGVNLNRLKDSAVRHGAISEADARAAGEADLLALVFRSEVSTSSMVTAISGRGLGMTIVRAKTEKLGGRVSLESTPQVGTRLRMLLPLTLATFRGILVSVADRIFVIPTVGVERVLRIKASDIHTVENRETITLQGQVVSLARLDAILELSPKPNQAEALVSLTAVVLRSADQRIAFAVNDVLHEEEVLVKPLRKPLVRVRNINGVTVLGSGKVVPILNVADLMKSARAHSAAPTQPTVITDKPQAIARRVLIVEDSITSRMLLKGILESAGYEVKTAVDGVEAFTALRENQFDLVVSDVEMPRMNGFDLTARIRADKRLAELPVVLVTALESREQRERGIDAGANAYIVKSSFDQSSLLEALRRLI